MDFLDVITGIAVFTDATYLTKEQYQFICTGKFIKQSDFWHHT